MCTHRWTNNRCVGLSSSSTLLCVQIVWLKCFASSWNVGGQHFSPTSSHTLGCHTCTSSSCCDDGVVAVQMELDYIIDDTAHVWYLLLHSANSWYCARWVFSMSCKMWYQFRQSILVQSWLTGILHWYLVWCCAVVMHHIVHAFWWCTRVHHWLYYCISICHMVCVCVLVSFAELQEWIVCCVLDRNTGWILGSVYSMLSFNDCSKELL